MPIRATANVLNTEMHLNLKDIHLNLKYIKNQASQVALVVKNLLTNAGDMRCRFDP